MKLTPSGIVIYPAELAALLKFTAKSKEDDLYCVHFRREDLKDVDSLVAYATNGKRALQAVGPVEADDGDAPEGEWTVHRSFLDVAFKTLVAEQYLLLCIEGTKVRKAEVNDAETHEILATLGWPTDAASTQMAFPREDLKKFIQLPTTERPVRCISINATYMVDLAAVARAAGSGRLDLYPGKTRQDGMVFAIEEEGMTGWRGILMPLRDRESSETDDGEDNEQSEMPKGKGKGRKGGKANRTPELPGIGG